MDTFEACTNNTEALSLYSSILASLSEFAESVDEVLCARLVQEVWTLCAQEAPLMQMVERRSRCEAYRPLDNCHSRARRDKRVTFDCSSLFSGRSEAFGSHGSREHVSNELFQYVYVISNPTCKKREPGLVDVFDASANSEDKNEGLPEGKRVIGSVGGIEAVSTGFIDCIPMGLLIDLGAVVGLVAARVLPQVGLAETPLRPYTFNLNGVSGKPLDILADLDSNSVTLKTTGEVFPSERLGLKKSTPRGSTRLIRPGGQVLVVSNVLGHVSEDSTVLVEGWPELDGTVSVARTLCSIYDMKVVVEMCNASTEDVVNKKRMLVATVTVVPKSAFDSEDGIRTSRLPGATPNFGETVEPILERDKTLREELDPYFSNSKLSGEQKELFRNTFSSFADLFVESSLKPCRTDLLEFSIDTGGHTPIKSRSYRVSKAEGD
ncbi:hypothetical protein PHMEG_00022793, partial [Phytophthora megakarya]